MTSRITSLPLQKLVPLAAKTIILNRSQVNVIKPPTVRRGGGMGPHCGNYRNVENIARGLESDVICLEISLFLKETAKKDSSSN
jgi:hypothetical protein